jgi:signal transduction histidine kinase
VKLTTRMWALGAVLPSVILLVGLAIAGQVFRVALTSSLDQGLMAQAAAESVSLFDRPEGPHLHMADSPLLAEVRPFAPTGELFDSHGVLVAHFPPLPHPEAKSPPPLEGPGNELRTTSSGGARVREIVVRVSSPSGERFLFRLSASMAQLDESVRQFHLAALLVVVLTAVVLASVQLVSGRRLSRRLAALSGHLTRLEQGALDAVPEPDTEGDEVSRLRTVLADATVELAAARDAQQRLLADAAHELRTPLTLMRTSLDLALRRQRGADELSQALVDTRTEVDRLAKLATSLLELGAARSQDVSEGDVRTLVDDATEAARAEAEVRGTWFEITGAVHAKARFSPVALRQAVDNLLSNALRFAPSGTAVRVDLHVDRTVRVSVSDEGPGIPPAERERIFAPFHRLDQRGGSGLGLAIVTEVMQLHHGRSFAVDPPSGRGACVVLELPVDRQ